MTYLVDTNIIIYLLEGKLTKKSEDYFISILDDIYISVISRIELLGWTGHNTESRKRYEMFLDMVTECSLNEGITKKTIDIKSSYNIKTADAIIAAMAILKNSSIISNDIGFKKINEIKVKDLSLKS